MPEFPQKLWDLNWKRSASGSAAAVFIPWEPMRSQQSLPPSARLNDAKEKGQDLVTLCSACHHVIKRVNDDMKNVEDIRTRANNYMALDEPYEGETNVLHYLEVLRDVVGFDELKKKVTNPLKGKKIGGLLWLPSSPSRKDHGV